MATLVMAAASLCGLRAQGLPSEDEIEFHNEQADTARITQMLVDLKPARRGEQPSVEAFARALAGAEYKGDVLDEAYSPELAVANPFGGGIATGGEAAEALVIDLDRMSDRTLVETALALAYTAGEGRLGWQDFAYNLRRLRYRAGEMRHYGSRLLYASDWVVDCAARGLLREVTADAPNVKYAVKSLDYISSHPELYPALADKERLAMVKGMEEGLSNYRYPVLRGSSLGDKSLRQLLRPGDVVLMCPADKTLDVSHMGIVVYDEGDASPRLLHPSEAQGEVVVDPLPLADYLRRNRVDGIRIIRLRTE